MLLNLLKAIGPSVNKGVLCTDLIRLFEVPIKDPSGEDAHPKSSRGLQKIVLQFERPARDRIMLLFFKFASIFGTLGGWITEGSMQADSEPADPSSILNIACNSLLQFLSDSRNTPLMRRQDGDAFSRASMVDGWNITCEVVKIQIQELHGLIAERRNNRKARKTTKLREEELITIREVEEDTGNWCQAVLVEFMGWVFLKMKPFVSAS